MLVLKSQVLPLDTQPRATEEPPVVRPAESCQSPGKSPEIGAGQHVSPNIRADTKFTLKALQCTEPYK